MEQFDTKNLSFYITGQGGNTAYKYLDSRRRICLGLVPDGTMIGLPQILFENQPMYTIEANSYCAVGSISLAKFKELFDRYK